MESKYKVKLNTDKGITGGPESGLLWNQHLSGSNRQTNSAMSSALALCYKPYYTAIKQSRDSQQKLRSLL